MSKGADLAYAVPGGWWCDTEQVAGTVAWTLVRLVLVSADDCAGSLTYYHINEEGRAALKDPDFIPTAIHAMRDHL